MIKKNPFFTFLFYDTTHNYCPETHVPIIFPVKTPACERISYNKTDYFNHYKNAAHFVDHEIGRVLAALGKEELKHTIIIITGDHGEEFGDSKQHYWGHSANYTRYQVGTPLIIHFPGKPKAVLTHRTSHYDIVPFLMQNIMHCDNPISDYSIGTRLLDKNPRAYLLVGSYINMGILSQNLNITLMTSGSIRVADSQDAYFPDIKPDLQQVSHALSDMRRYYIHSL